jgi:phosphoserine phosphatase RsbU/P
MSVQEVRTAISPSIPQSRPGWRSGGQPVGRANALVPAAIIVLFTVMDIAAGPQGILAGLVVIAPLTAASLLGRRATLLYAVLALAVAAALGIYDQQYTAAAWPTQAARLFGVALGGLIAVTTCTERLARERRLRQLSGDSARADARARDAEGMAGLAEWLQRSLLTELPPVPHVEIAARYLPAADHVKIGGDWHDAFPGPDERTLLAIGDVAGHDGPAAAVMAQLRSILRGIGQVIPGSPAVLLTALDHAAQSLLPGALATIIVAEIRRDRTDDRRPLVLRWSNAGHPPPLLITSDGTTRLLEYEPDVLLGVEPDAVRTDHEQLLHPGDTVVMYTDGLVERPEITIDEGLRRLRDAAARHADLSPEELCDALLLNRGNQANDDIALLALRVPPR